MQRRSFLKLLSSLPIVASLPLSLTPQRNLSGWEKMVYAASKARGLAKRCLMYDELPLGALARYEKDRGQDVYISYYHNDTDINEKIICDELDRPRDECLIPTGTIATRSNNIEGAQYKTETQQDKLFLNLIKHTCNKNKQIVVSKGKEMLPSMNEAFCFVEMHDLTVDKIIMHPDIAIDFIQDYFPTVCDVCDKKTDKEMNKDGIIGHLWTASINVSDLVPKDEMYFLASKEYVGVIPSRQEVHHCTKDIYAQESGMCILNDYTISSVKIKG